MVITEDEIGDCDNENDPDYSEQETSRNDHTRLLVL